MEAVPELANGLEPLHAVMGRAHRSRAATACAITEISKRRNATYTKFLTLPAPPPPQPPPARLPPPPPPLLPPPPTPPHQKNTTHTNTHTPTYSLTYPSTPPSLLSP